MATPGVESSRAKAAFEAYVALGPQRSLEKLAQSGPKGTPSVRQLKRWCSAYDWVMRALAYDTEQRERQRAEREEAEKAERERLRALSYAVRERRVALMIEEIDSIQAIKIARATAEQALGTEFPDRAIPGAETGLMARHWKAIGKGAVEEAEFDDAPVARQQSLLKQIAEDLGQWATKNTINFEGWSEEQIIAYAAARGVEITGRSRPATA